MERVFIVENNISTCALDAGSIASRASKSEIRGNARVIVSLFETPKLFVQR